jgi:hypothetical protein
MVDADEVRMILLVVMTASVAWSCDATLVTDGRAESAEHRALTIRMPQILKAKSRGPFSIKGKPGRSLDAAWIEGNSLMHLVETGPAKPAKLVIEEPLTDGHSAHADGVCRFKGTPQ